MVRTIVIVQPWRVEDQGHRVPTGHIIGPCDPIDANLSRIDGRVPARYLCKYMEVGIEVVPRHRAALVDGHELGSEIIVHVRDAVGAPGWQVANAALDPNDAVHRQWEMRDPLLGC